MKLGASGEALIKHYESCRLRAYPDPATGGAPWTIGWGATGPTIGPGSVWTQAQADARFVADAASRASQIQGLLGAAPTTQNQFDAMMSLLYNIGTGKFSTSSVLRCHKARDYATARKSFALWNKAAGRVMDGLVKRRAAEAALYGTVGTADIARILQQVEGGN